MRIYAYRRVLEWIGFGLLVLSFGHPLALGVAPQRPEELPVVVFASMPLYPRTAQLAHIQGTVRLRVTTDGKNISSTEAESGPPMLLQAALENVRTWQFAPDKPRTFGITFNFVLEDPPECEVQNATVVAHMPSEVRVSAKAVHTCDPTLTKPK